MVLLGAEAEGGDLKLGASIEKITYRGTYTDYALRLDDGQRLSAIQSRKGGLREGDSVALGARAEDIVLLEED